MAVNRVSKEAPANQFIKGQNSAHAWLGVWFAVVMAERVKVEHDPKAQKFYINFGEGN